MTNLCISQALGPLGDLQVAINIVIAKKSCEILEKAWSHIPRHISPWVRVFCFSLFRSCNLFLETAGTISFKRIVSFKVDWLLPIVNCLCFFFFSQLTPVLWSTLKSFGLLMPSLSVSDFCLFFFLSELFFCLLSIHWKGCSICAYCELLWW